MAREHDMEQYQTSTAPLEEFLVEVGMNYSDFAKLVGVSSGTPSAWVRQKKMPKWVLLAIEALRKAKPSDVRLIVSPGSKLAAIQSVLNAMSVPFKEI